MYRILSRAIRSKHYVHYIVSRILELLSSESAKKLDVAYRHSGMKGRTLV